MAAVQGYRYAIQSRLLLFVGFDEIGRVCCVQKLPKLTLLPFLHTLPWMIACVWAFEGIYRPYAVLVVGGASLVQLYASGAASVLQHTSLEKMSDLLDSFNLFAIGTAESFQLAFKSDGYSVHVKIMLGHRHTR